MKSFRFNPISFFLLFAIAFVATTLITSNVLYAEEDYAYPELLTTPRASQRLHYEAMLERDEGFFANLPMQVSALATFTSGVLQLGGVDRSKDENKRSPLVGIVVGAAWIGLNYYLGAHYQLYNRGHNEIQKLPSSSKKDQLLRERLAEEKLNNAGKLGNRLRWLSVFTNLGASVFMLTNAEKNSTAQVSDLVSTAVALGPLLFTNHWTNVAHQQRSYKKKIYAPIVSSTMFFDDLSKRLIPGIALSMTF